MKNFTLRNTHDLHGVFNQDQSRIGRKRYPLHKNLTSENLTKKQEEILRERHKIFDFALIQNLSNPASFTVRKPRYEDIKEKSDFEIQCDINPMHDIGFQTDIATPKLPRVSIEVSKPSSSVHDLKLSPKFITPALSLSPIPIYSKNRPKVLQENPIVGYSRDFLPISPARRSMGDYAGAILKKDNFKLI